MAVDLTKLKNKFIDVLENVTQEEFEQWLLTKTKPMAQHPTISKMERVQTAVEWLVEQLWAPCRGIPSHIIEQAKQMEKEQHGLFLHWFVKHYETATIDGMFGFVDAMGKEVTVKEIVDHYYNETYGKE